MPRVGRALRAKLRDDARETPERVVERVRFREIAERAVRERAERYPVLTPENVREALAWQDARIRELLGVM